MADSDIKGLAGLLIWTTSERHPIMAAFYRDVLGLAPRSDRSGFINFAWGDTRLTIAVHSDLHGAATDPLRIMLNLATDDIHGVAERLAERGVEFLRPASQEPWGGWVATFLDPDGNILQLLQTA